MNTEYLRIAGVVLSLAGTLVLAVRVTKILSVLSSAAKVADLNLRIEAQRASGDRSVPNIRMVGMSTHIEGVEKLGTKLLVLGFALQIAGAIATGLSFLL